MAEVQKDGIINQINNPEVSVNVNEAKYIIEQQKIQLKIITDKLNTAYKGGDVTYILTAGMLGEFVNVYVSEVNSVKNKSISIRHSERRMKMNG